MASPAPSPRGTPPTLKVRLSGDPMHDPLSSLSRQTTAGNAAAAGRAEREEQQQQQQRDSSKLLNFALAEVATVSPLPPRVASRWSREFRPLSGSLATRHSIDAKLSAAEAKRQASFFLRERDGRNFFFFLSRWPVGQPLRAHGSLFATQSRLASDYLTKTPRKISRLVL